ncbi:hypothetical protein [Halorubrum sp. FL23]|uniref:hypothetical protein n=1 Tax=Halorubrum sp. FL23 TaxID=3458704 RepID=UPI004033351F
MAEYGERCRETLGAGASAAMLAGCAGDGGLVPSDGSDGTDDSDGSDGAETLTGNFRLLISDAPADIGDFDRLDITLGEARIFEATEGGDDGSTSDGTEADDESSDAEDGTTANGTDN